MILKSVLKTVTTVFKRHYSSALYVTGDKAMETYAVLVPHLDLEKKFQEMDKLKANLVVRKLDIDPIKLKSLWDFLKNLEATKTQLEKRRVEIADHMKDFRKIGEDSEVKTEIEKLKLEGRIVREDLKTLMKAFWEVEEKVMVNGLQLPNELHFETPLEDPKIIHQHLDRPHVNQIESNIDIGTKLNLIDYRDHTWVYYMDMAADMELALSEYFTEHLKQDGFIPLCNPDFVRSVVVEGCATNHRDTESVFIVDENIDKVNENFRLHLVGGASIYPFCAFHTKQKINFSSLPLKYVTSGRQYKPGSSSSSKRSLFNVWQSTACEIFILTQDNHDDMKDEFDRLLKKLTQLYSELDTHFRVVYVQASELEPWESLRASFEMYSCHEQKYVQVGCISLSDDYICKRLLMTYNISETNSTTRFCNMISGTVMDFPKIFGCILELTENNNFVLPDCLKSYCLGY